MKTTIKVNNPKLRIWAQEVLDLVDLKPIKVVIDQDKESNVLSYLLSDGKAFAFTFVDSEEFKIDKQIRIFAFNIQEIVRYQRGKFTYKQVFKFILAHELGHYNMILRGVPQRLNNETRADRFAANLLGYQIVHTHGRYE